MSDANKNKEIDTLENKIRNDIKTGKIKYGGFYDEAISHMKNINVLLVEINNNIQRLTDKYYRNV